MSSNSAQVENHRQPKSVCCAANASWRDYLLLLCGILLMTVLLSFYYYFYLLRIDLFASETVGQSLSNERSQSVNGTIQPPI
jgi:hypothetical protein